MQCEIRERDSGNTNPDKTITYYLVTNYDKTVTLLDKMDVEKKQQLCDALETTEESIKQGKHAIEAALSYMNDDQKRTVDEIIRSME